MAVEWIECGGRRGWRWRWPSFPTAAALPPRHPTPPGHRAAPPRLAADAAWPLAPPGRLADRLPQHCGWPLFRRAGRLTQRRAWPLVRRAACPLLKGQERHFSYPGPYVRFAKWLNPHRIATEWCGGRNKARRWHIGRLELLSGTETCIIFLNGIHVKTSLINHVGRN